MLKNVAELRSYRTSCEKALGEQSIRVLVCAGTGCVAGGSLDIYKRLVTLCEEQGLNVQVKLEKEVEHSGIGIKKSGCHGFCELGRKNIKK